MAITVYVLSALTSACCAWLLLREYRRAAIPLLFWSSLSFLFWTASNVLLFVDFVLVPHIDLALWRAVLTLLAVLLLLYGLIWENS